MQVGAIPEMRTQRKSKCGEDARDCWVCSSSRTPGEIVRNKGALESELRGGMGETGTAHHPHNQDGLAVGVEASSSRYSLPKEIVSGLMGKGEVRREVWGGALVLITESNGVKSLEKDCYQTKMSQGKTKQKHSLF